MPTFYPPKLVEQYNTSLQIPQFSTATLVQDEFVLASDGNGGTHFVTRLPAVGAMSTLFVAESISTHTITIFGEDTLTVQGQSFLSSVQINGDLNLDSSTGDGGSITANGMNVNRISTANVQLSTVTFLDITDSSLAKDLYVQNSLLYFNGSQVASGNGEIPSDISFSTVSIQDTLSTSSTFTNYISTDIATSSHIEVSSIAFIVRDLSGGYPLLYTQGLDLYFNGAPVGGGGSVDSNIGFSNVAILDTLSTSSTFTNYISSGLLQTSTVGLADITNSASVLNLYNQGGSLYFNGSTVGGGGGSVSSNIGFSNVAILDTLSTSSTFTNYISSLFIASETISTLNTQTSTLNLVDTTNATSVLNLYNQGGSLYFNGSVVGGGGGSVSSNIGFSNVAILNTLSTSSTFTNYISSGLLQTSTVGLADITNSASVLNLYNQGGSLYFNGSAVGGGGGGSVSSNIGFSNVNILNSLSAPIFHTSTISFKNEIVLNTITGSKVGIGSSAGEFNQGSSSIAIGNNAGYLNQNFGSVALGYQAAQYTQGIASVAIGYQSGNLTQAGYSVAIGPYTATSGQKAAAIAIGNGAGQTNQGVGAIAIGPSSGQTDQGNNSIAIGGNAGVESQSTNTIILNATGNTLNSVNDNSLYIAPIRSDAIPNYSLKYNSTSKEITIGPMFQSGSGTADGSGAATITFSSRFQSPPIVVGNTTNSFNNTISFSNTTTSNTNAITSANATFNWMAMGV